MRADLRRALLFGPLAPSCFRLEGPDAMPEAPVRFAREAAAFGAITSNELTERERSYWSLLQRAAAGRAGMTDKAADLQFGQAAKSGQPQPAIASSAAPLNARQYVLDSDWGQVATACRRAKRLPRIALLGRVQRQWSFLPCLHPCGPDGSGSRLWARFLALPYL